MVKLWRAQAEGLVDQQLAGSRDEQVFSAHDFGDGHRGIIDHDGELVSGLSIFAPDQKVTKVTQALESAGAKAKVVELDLSIAGHAKAPICVAWSLGGFTGADWRA